MSFAPGCAAYAACLDGAEVSDEADKAFVGMVARALAADAGTCKYCGCHGDSCGLSDGDRCAWANVTRTVCTGKACLIRWGQERQRRFGRRRTKGRAA